MYMIYTYMYVGCLRVWGYLGIMWVLEFPKNWTPFWEPLAVVRIIVFEIICTLCEGSGSKAGTSRL